MWIMLFVLARKVLIGGNLVWCNFVGLYVACGMGGLVLVGLGIEKGNLLRHFGCFPGWINPSRPCWSVWKNGDASRCVRFTSSWAYGAAAVLPGVPCSHPIWLKAKSFGVLNTWRLGSGQNAYLGTRDKIKARVTWIESAWKSRCNTWNMCWLWLPRHVVYAISYTYTHTHTHIYIYIYTYIRRILIWPCMGGFFERNKWWTEFRTHNCKKPSFVWGRLLSSANTRIAMPLLLRQSWRLEIISFSACFSSSK